MFSCHAAREKLKFIRRQQRNNKRCERRERKNGKMASMMFLLSVETWVWWFHTVFDFMDLWFWSTAQSCFALPVKSHFGTENNKMVLRSAKSLEIYGSSLPLAQLSRYHGRINLFSSCFNSCNAPKWRRSNWNIMLEGSMGRDRTLTQYEHRDELKLQLGDCCVAQPPRSEDLWLAIKEMIGASSRKTVCGMSVKFE